MYQGSTKEICSSVFLLDVVFLDPDSRTECLGFFCECVCVFLCVSRHELQAELQAGTARLLQCSQFVFAAESLMQIGSGRKCTRAGGHCCFQCLSLGS